MSDSDIYAIGFLLVVFFLMFGAAVPLAVFWYNREDARVYDGVRTRLVEELARLSLDVDELIKDLDHVREQLYEERKQRAMKERDFELLMAANIQLGDQVAELQRQVATVQELKRENVTLRAENAMLRDEQEKLKNRVAHLEADLAKRGTGPLPALD